jgi:hypothetical protein
MTQLHHIIPRAAIKRERSKVNLRVQRFEEITEAEAKLISTPISRIFDDSRNLVKLTKREHERHHTGTLRLDRSKLPSEIEEFAAWYGLEAALDHELGLIRNGGRV